MTEWEQDRLHMGWAMPAAPWWKRLPVIRHARAVLMYAELREIEKSTGYPETLRRWVALGTWKGKEG
ncbi:hypothetical protein [Roseovarius sp. MMSF_3281]|uniref:hypothetical protein n=1 Tax=Roseovarius sp. MMSF_3281 TaxID=3046694 RepID=UPI00273D1CEF|nr:hypothetical protein [Roseovarius sp. MMSF_3281]